jgi:hypothetical protein
MGVVFRSLVIISAIGINRSRLRSQATMPNYSGVPLIGVDLSSSCASLSRCGRKLGELHEVGTRSRTSGCRNRNALVLWRCAAKGPLTDATEALPYGEPDGKPSGPITRMYAPEDDYCVSSNWQSSNRARRNVSRHEHSRAAGPISSFFCGLATGGRRRTWVWRADEHRCQATQGG